MTAGVGEFFVTEANLNAESPSYVVREADDELRDALARGEYCYVLNSRQMGKSSLMRRVEARLGGEGFAVSAVDLTAIGSAGIGVEKWYYSLLYRVSDRIGAWAEARECWKSDADLAPMPRFMAAIRRGVLPRCPSGLIIFLDEIDVVLKLPFSADDLFAGIRECFQRQVADPSTARLTFCLLGLANPIDLIRDPHTTPFNIARRVELKDFTLPEAATLARGLGRPEPAASRLIRRIYRWTGGQPYLTQSLASAVADDPSIVDEKGVDRACQALFLNSEARGADKNLGPVGRYLVNDDVPRADILRLYRRALRRRGVAVKPTDPLVGILRLSGIVRDRRDSLVVRNRIYARVFDHAWIRLMMDSEARARRRAFFQGVTLASLVGGVAIACLLWLGLRAREQRLRADRNFVQSQENLLAARVNLHEAGRQKGLADQQKGLADQQKGLAQRREIEARNQRNRAEQGLALASLREREARANLYVANLNLAAQSRDQGNLSRAWELLDAVSPEAGSPDPRGFEWYRLFRLCQPGRTASIGAENALLAMASTPDGRSIATGGVDGKVRLWDASTLKIRATLNGHDYHVHCLAYSPDGKILASGGCDRTLRLWGAESGALIGTPLLGHSDEITRVAFSPDGKALATSSKDGTARLWDPATRGALGVLGDGSAAMRCLAFSGDGRTLAISDANGRVRTWDVASRREGAMISDEGGSVTCLAYSPDGKLLASGGDDHEVRLWDAGTGRRLWSSTVHDDVIGAICFSPDGKSLATGGFDHQVKLWDVARAVSPAKPDEAIPSPSTPARSLAHTSRVEALAFAGDSLVVAGSDGSIRIWDHIEEDQASGSRLKHLGPVKSLAFAPDGRTLATITGESLVNLWDIAAERSTGTFFASKDNGVFTNSLAFSPDGRTLALGNDDGTILLRDLGARQSRAFTRQSRSIKSVCFSPDGRRIAAGGQDNTARVWDLAGGSVLQTLAGHTDYVNGVAFSPDGRLVATAGGDNTARLWDATTGRSLAILDHRFKAQKWNSDQRWVFSVAFSPDGQVLATGTSYGKVKLWEVPGGRELDSLEAFTTGVESLDYSRDGRRLVAFASDGTVKVWDASSRQELTTFREPGGIADGACSPDGRTLAIGIERAGRTVLRTKDQFWRLGGEVRLLRSATDLEVGREHVRVGRWSRAVADLDRATAREGAPPEAWYLRGRAHSRLGNAAWALADFDRAAAMGQDGAEFLFERGHAEARLGQGDRALADLTRALEIEPGEGAIRLELSLLHARAGRRDLAEAEYRRAAEGSKAMTPTTDRWWRDWKEGVARFEPGRWDIPGPLPPTTGGLGPESWWEASGSGLALAAMSRWADAADAFGRAVRARPEASESWFGLGMACSHEARLNEAEAAWTRAIEIDASGWEVWYCRGINRSRQGQHVLAIADLTQSIALGCPGWVVWGQRAYARLQLKEWELASRDSSRAIDLNPGDGFPWYYRGWARVELKQWDAARVDLTRAAESHNTDRGWAIRSRALAHAGLGRWA